VREQIRKIWLLTSVLLPLITSCHQEPDPAYYSSQIKVDSTRIDSIGYRESRVQSTILNPYQLELSAGHCWSQGRIPTLSDSHSEFQVSSKEHTILDQIAGLEPGTEYQIRAYFRNQWDTVFGPSITVMTKTVTKPVVITLEAAQVMAASALVGGVVEDDGGEEVTERGVYWGTSMNVNTTGTKVILAKGLGEFNHVIADLVPGETYYIQAYGINNIGIGFGEEFYFKTLQGFMDMRDGHFYAFKTIGNQTWMAENLAILPSVSPSSAGSESDKHYYVFGYEGTMVNAAMATGNYATYGVLYNWASAMNGATSSNSIPSGVQGICPDGWHLPSDPEWKELEIFLGMSESAANDISWRNSGSVGGKLKDIGIAYWLSPNTGANNSVSFRALPAGYRDRSGSFNDLRSNAFFWTTTKYDGSTAWRRGLLYSSEGISRANYYISGGFSIRCIRD